jgi:hypothetical protein
MTIDTPQKGTYVLTGYFHDSAADQGPAELSLSVDGGTTYAYGPDAFVNSTGSNPPEIATQSIVFTADGSNQVVLKVSNPDLPAPTVRPILDGFDLLLLDTDIARIDFFDSSQGVSPVQSGFQAVDAADASDGSPVNIGIASVSLASGGVEVGGTGVSGRDRGPLDPGQSESDLARDFAFAFGEDLLLTIDGLEATSYVFTGFFHDSTVDQGAAEFSVSVDGGLTYTVGPIGFDNSTGTDPTAVSYANTVITPNGVDPVVVKISNPDLPAPSVRPILDGFVLYVPEPSGMLGLISGIGLLAALRRRRRG